MHLGNLQRSRDLNNPLVSQSDTLRLIANAFGEFSESNLGLSIKKTNMTFLSTNNAEATESCKSAIPIITASSFQVCLTLLFVQLSRVITMCLYFLNLIIGNSRERVARTSCDRIVSLFLFANFGR